MSAPVSAVVFRGAADSCPCPGVSGAAEVPGDAASWAIGVSTVHSGVGFDRRAFPTSSWPIVA